MTTAELNSSPQLYSHYFPRIAGLIVNKDLIDPGRLRTAYETARQDLLQLRHSGGYWEGELAASALSTATAVSALSLLRREAKAAGQAELIAGGIQWLAERQNPDGGWGDTDRSYSNVATTMLVVAAFHLADQADQHQELLSAADSYVDGQGRVAALRRRYGRDKTFAVPILTNCALAGLVDWRDVSPLPFELACFPQSWYRFLRMPVVSYAIPALVAIGQARFRHRPPWNPLLRGIRQAAVGPSLKVLQRMQPASGGYLEAVPLTSFVVMSLASIGCSSHPVARAGQRFLADSVRPDGSWPIDTNLATWNTTLAVNALASDERPTGASLDWLLSCQHRERHPFTGADPGGWGWSDLSGAVPDADDTPGALIALADWPAEDGQREAIDAAAAAGLDWLLKLQNSDGGWPTFCRGWGKLPFDRSGTDLTAHALRAIHAWRERLPEMGYEGRAATAIQRGLSYLGSSQREDGSWYPLWFGNQDHTHEENPVYGTAKVLRAYFELGFSELPAAKRGLEWLTGNQNADGGWGGGRSIGTEGGPTSSVEETALVVEQLALYAASTGSGQAALNKGLTWLIESVERGGHREPSPIGFYFAKLWYYEKLYPITFTVAALGQALSCMDGRPEEGIHRADLVC